MHHYDLNLKSQDISPAMLKQYDCVIIATAHDKFDYDMIRQHASLIVDTRGIYYELNEPHIVSA
jgi:UDP-N-acetyl-D-glucosamine dehydrogenase